MTTVKMYCSTCNAYTERPTVTVDQTPDGLRINGKCGSCGK